MILLLPVVAALLRGLALPGLYLPAECTLLVIPLRALYWEKGGRWWMDYLGGVVHVLIYFSFLHHTVPFAPIPVALILGAWWILERWLYLGMRRLLSAGAAAALAILAVEFLRFRMPMGGVPWGSLALGWADRPVARDWGAVLGESGWTVLIAFAGAFLYSFFSRRRLLDLSVAPLLLLCVVFLVPPPPPPLDSIRTLSIQGNLSRFEKHGDERVEVSWQASEVYRRQAVITWQALLEEPEAKFVLWSETMYPFPVGPNADDPFGEGFMVRPWPTREEQKSLDYLRQWNRAHVSYLIGPPETERIFVTGAHFYLGVEEKEREWRVGEPREPETWSPRTSEFLAFDAGGELVDYFSKSELVPFGERLPFHGNFPGGDWFALEVLRATKLFPRFASTGRKGPLEVQGHTLGGAVCWENVYERPFREQADRGAEAFLILSNENWFALSQEMDQMVCSTRWRAAETGRPILRVANTGITGLFDARGRLLGELPRGRAGWMGADLDLIDGGLRTPYQRFGWLLQPILAWAGLVLAAVGLLLGRRAQASPRSEEAPTAALDPSSGHR